MSESSLPSPSPHPGGNSDSLDVLTLQIDGPSDLPVGPVHPAVRKVLDAERAKIRRWMTWLEQGGSEAPPGPGG